MISTRREFIRQLLIAGSAFAVAPQLGRASALSNLSYRNRTDDPWQITMPRILAGIKPPEFPNRSFLITKFGAEGDGSTDCTKAFRAAIEACSKAGGGKVVVPTGVFLTGAVRLLSNVNLQVSSGAIIKFSRNPKDYLPAVFTRWEG